MKNKKSLFFLSFLLLFQFSFVYSASDSLVVSGGEGKSFLSRLCFCCCPCFSRKRQPVSPGGRLDGVETPTLSPRSVLSVMVTSETFDREYRLLDDNGEDCFSSGVGAIDPAGWAKKEMLRFLKLAQDSFASYSEAPESTVLRSLSRDNLYGFSKCAVIASLDYMKHVYGDDVCYEVLGSSVEHDEVRVISVVGEVCGPDRVVRIIRINMVGEILISYRD